MVGISLPLSQTVASCSKPNCRHRAAVNRHHRAHEALWLGPWAHRGGEPKWRAFVERYYEFREEDIVRLCLPHHAEIHALYDEVIADDTAKTGSALYLYSWKQGRILMDRLRDTCTGWLLYQSPGLDGDLYERTKKLRRSILNRESALRHPSKEGHKAVAKLRGRKLRKKRKKKP